LAAPLVSGALLLLTVAPIHLRATTWPRLAGLVFLGLLVFYASTWFLMAEDERGLVKNYLKFNPS
jgi:hypothetical protein